VKLPGVGVFSVEPTAVQLSWDRLPAREVTFEVGGRRFEVAARPPEWYRLWGRRRLHSRFGGPGALLVEGLEPGTSYDVVVGGSLVATAITPVPPPGRVLARFATVNDCHIGERRFGPTGLLHERGALPAYPVQALRAAIQEIEAWGADALIAKGDITQKSKPAEAETAAEVLANAAIPVHAVLGNHDVHPGADVAGVLREAGIKATTEAHAVDLPGVRIVLGHSPVRGRHSGLIEAEHLEELIFLASETRSPAVVAVHHPPGLRRLPRYYPPPIGRADSLALTQRLAEADPAAVLLAGHTHRTRWYRAGPLPVAEVGSTKDYPGQWAGYTVYEGGITQVSRRISHPDVIAWTEMTARALGGLWGWWSPGRLTDRSWCYEWPVRAW
jgi:Icc protein